MKILYDDNMPLAAECFAQLGDAEAFAADNLEPEMLNDVDALLVRSTTTVDAQLLKYAKRLKWVATATAGFNHLDIEYLTQANIPWYSAAGCNAIAVAEYVVSCLFVHAEKNGADLAWLRTLTVGIVGAGHVGSALATKLDALQINYILCDPPLQLTQDPRSFVTLEEIKLCDVICLHVPFIKEGKHPTEKLIDKTFLSALKPSQLVINACRGGVLDEQALLQLVSQQTGPKFMLDAWENEPHINYALIGHTEIATPHIAGHSVEGKSRGTLMVYDWLCQQLEVPSTLLLAELLPQLTPLELSIADLDDRIIQRLIFSLYDSREDDRNFRAAMAQSHAQQGQFQRLRKHYWQRREFSALPLRIVTDTPHHPVVSTLSALGFAIQLI